MVNAINERLPEFGLCKFDSETIDAPMTNPLSSYLNRYYLWQIRSHSSVKQLGQPVMYLKILVAPIMQECANFA